MITKRQFLTLLESDGATTDTDPDLIDVRSRLAHLADESDVSAAVIAMIANARHYAVGRRREAERHEALAARLATMIARAARQGQQS